MLAIDCGNTRIKWARFEAGQRHGEGVVDLTSDDAYTTLAVALDVPADAAGPVGSAPRSARSNRVWVANVAGSEVAERIAATVSSVLDVAPEFVTVKPRAYGIECGYSEPETLGVDRWLAMIATRQLVDGPFAVVCAGTAVTFDAVDATGRHLGGLILPGDRLMLEAMAEKTSQIPLVDPAGPAVTGIDLLGRSTAKAVAHGTRLALAAAVDRAIATVRDALATDLAVVLTGGDAPILAQWLASEATVRADLVLDGLAVIAADEE